MIDSANQRRIMGHFATGVTVVTTRLAEERHGLTVNAFCSLSLDPPLVVVAIDRRSYSYEFLKSAGCFAVNILSAEQEDLSRRFAIPGPKSFDDLPLKTASTGAPILDGCLAWVDCRITEVYQGGDHDLFVGQIMEGDAQDLIPLTYYRGRYRQLKELDVES